MNALNATAGIMIVLDIKLAIDLFGAGKRGLRQCSVSPRLGPNAKRQRMKLGPILREALRNFVCACFAYALVLQVVLGGAAGAANATTVGAGVICTSEGSQRSPEVATDADYHAAGQDCCALGCPASTGATLGHAPMSFVRLRPGPSSRISLTAVIGNMIRGPPVRSTPQAPRAPPVLSAPRIPRG